MVQHACAVAVRSFLVYFTLVTLYTYCLHTYNTNYIPLIEQFVFNAHSCCTNHHIPTTVLQLASQLDRLTHTTRPSRHQRGSDKARQEDFSNWSYMYKMQSRNQQVVAKRFIVHSGSEILATLARLYARMDISLPDLQLEGKSVGQARVVVVFPRSKSREC